MGGAEAETLQFGSRTASILENMRQVGYLYYGPDFFVSTDRNPSGVQISTYFFDDPGASPHRKSGHVDRSFYLIALDEESDQAPGQRQFSINSHLGSLYTRLGNIEVLPSRGRSGIGTALELAAIQMCQLEATRRNRAIQRSVDIPQIGAAAAARFFRNFPAEHVVVPGSGEREWSDLDRIALIELVGGKQRGYNYQPQVVQLKVGDVEELTAQREAHFEAVVKGALAPARP